MIVKVYIGEAQFPQDHDYELLDAHAAGERFGEALAGVEVGERLFADAVAVEEGA